MEEVQEGGASFRALHRTQDLKQWNPGQRYSRNIECIVNDYDYRMYGSAAFISLVLQVDSHPYRTALTSSA